MQIQQASVKLFITADSSYELAAFTPIFHAWIRDKKISDQLLIDVADYQHVPHGPGIMLIANEAHYGIDSTGGHAGLRYQRRRDEAGDAKASLRDALKRAVSAASMLQQEKSMAGKLKFRTDNLQMRVLSRLRAPNAEATRASLQPIWAQVLSEAGFAGAEFAPEADSRSPFGLTLASCKTAPDLAALQAAL